MLHGFNCTKDFLPWPIFRDFNEDSRLKDKNMRLVIKGSLRTRIRTGINISAEFTLITIIIIVVGVAYIHTYIKRIYMAPTKATVSMRLCLKSH